VPRLVMAVRIPKRLTSICVALALTPILTREIRGGYYPAYDLRSLATISKCIVLARDISSHSVEHGMHFKTFVVEKAYKGPLLPGMEVSVFDDYPRSDRSGAALSFDPEVILFLEDADSPQWSPLFRKTVERPTHGIIVSGLRLLKDKEVYDFVQFENPGDAFPHLLRQLSKDAEGDDAAANEGLPITFDFYEKEILKEIRVVEAVHATLAKSQEPRLREALLRIIEKAYSRDAASRRKRRAKGMWTFEGREQLLSQVVDRLQADGDTEGILEVMQRAPRSGSLGCVRGQSPFGGVSTRGGARRGP
jgi:hypothetical protein